jgi:phosphatidylinositol glycan class V
LVGRVFSGFAKWDGLFFLQIAHEGYLFEKNHAFFPGFPLVIRAIGTVLTHFLPFLSRDEVFLISGVIIAWTCSVISALLMEKLTDVLFKDGLFTRAVCFMFILTPANIFLSAV